LRKIEEMLALSVVFAAVLFVVTVAYPYQARYKNMEATVDCHKYPAVISYHVHVTYMLTNDEEVAEASAFRDATQEYFAPFLGSDPVCQGTKEDSSGRYGTAKTMFTLRLARSNCGLLSPPFGTDNGRICMIYDHNLTNDTLGPFAVGEWSKSADRLQQNFGMGQQAYLLPNTWFSFARHLIVGMFVPVHYYGAVVPWFVSHRGNFSLLVHPNTGCGT
jgi:aromatic ring-cleaving dioxygenase